MKFFHHYRMTVGVVLCILSETYRGKQVKKASTSGILSDSHEEIPKCLHKIIKI